MVDFPRKAHYNVEDFRRIVEVLRGEGGCPWDREQTHQSLRRGMLEEAYEACGAIDEGDPVHLREELGDVMLQVIFHASLASEEGWFDLDDVADAACQKLIYRHPHVFGGTHVSGTEEVLENWDALKEAEKRQRTLAEVLEGVTPALPALWRAEKCQNKMAKAGRGTDPEEASRTLRTAEEELRRTEPESREAFEKTGEMLFAAVALARAQGIDPEMALHGACARCIEDVRAAENTIRR